MNCAPSPDSMAEPRPLLTRRRLLAAAALYAGAATLPGSLRRGGHALPSSHSAGASMPDSPAILALGDPRASQLGSNASEVERHRVGMDFYKRHWPVNRLGRARYLQGPYSFDIPRVSNVMGSLDRGDPGRGIYAWDVSAFPMDGERVPHRVARDELFALLAQMRRAGWRRVLSHSSPRLAGEDALRYALVKHGIYSLDPDYLPSFCVFRSIVTAHSGRT